MRSILILLGLYTALVVTRACAAPAPADLKGIDTAVREKSGHAAASVHIAGEWAISDEVLDGTKFAVAVLRKINDHWVVTAEMAGAGLPTPEALIYHEMPAEAVVTVLNGRARDEMKPIVKLLRTMNPKLYPEGYLFENITVADNWALCLYRNRAGLRKSDVLGQALLRRTSEKWHLVEQADDHPIDLKQYGVPLKLQRTLHGEGV